MIHGLLNLGKRPVEMELRSNASGLIDGRRNGMYLSLRTGMIYHDAPSNMAMLWVSRQCQVNFC